MNLASKLLQNYNSMPDKICLVQNNEKITYKDLYNKTLNFKEYLKNQGISKGSKVLVLVPMSKELYITLLAIWAIGAVPCFMDAGFIRSGVKKNEFNQIDALIGISKYIAYSNINKNLRKLRLKINVEIVNKLSKSNQDDKKINRNIQVDEQFKKNQDNKKLKEDIQHTENLEGNIHDNESLKENIQSDYKLEIEELENDFPAILTYTSGTTGKPKTVARSHEFLKIQGDILEKEIKYDKNDIELSTIPIFTLSNINVGITTVIANGNYSNLGKSSAKKLVKQIEENKVNRLMASPGVLDVITSYCIKKQKRLSGVYKIFTGGGAVFLDFIDKLKQVFQNAQIVTLYGSTEAEPIAKLEFDKMTQEDVKNTQTGMGILAGNVVGVDECKIINTGIKQIGNITKEEFLNLQVEVGEIVVAGRNVLEGYVDGVGDAENKFSVDGKKYHRTGDVGYIDKNNRLWLRGRVAEPYFNIEAMLHSKLKIGKTAIFDYNGKIILVLEKRDKITLKDIKQAFDFERPNFEETNLEKNNKEANFEKNNEKFNFEATKFEATNFEKSNLEKSNFEEQCIKIQPKIDEIKYVKKIPVDKRHSTKVDYKELRKILKI